MFRNVIHGSDAFTFTSSCIFHDPDNSFSFLYCSNVFNEVEVNSYQIWKYQYYYLVMEYSKQPPLAPPFAILYHIVEFVRWLGKKCRKNKVSRKYSTLAKPCLLFLFLFMSVAKHKRLVNTDIECFPVVLEILMLRSFRHDDGDVKENIT